jgi:hypothetical protein
MMPILCVVVAFGQPTTYLYNSQVTFTECNWAVPANGSCPANYASDYINAVLVY